MPAFEVLEFVELFGAAVGELNHGRRGKPRRASGLGASSTSPVPKRQLVLTLYYGLEDGSARTLRAIGGELGVSHEAVRQTRDRGVAEIIWRAMGDDASKTCVAVVRQARSLARRFETDPVALVEAFETWRYEQPAREWVILALCLAGIGRPRACRLARDACDRRRASVLAAKVDRRVALRAHRTADLLGRFIDQALWPSTAHRDWTLAAFSAQRHVQADRDTTGSFRSAKMGRTVQYESGLELGFLNRLEAATEVAGYQEQALAIQYVIDGSCPPRKTRLRPGRSPGC